MTSSRWSTLERSVGGASGGAIADRDERGLSAAVARRRVVHDGRRCAVSNDGLVRVVRRSSGPRLTRRGRVVLILLPLAALLIAALLVIAPPIAQATDGPVALHTVTVHDGDTMWAIAQHLAPRSDPRDVVLELERVNHLADAAIMPGQRLRVPSTFSAQSQGR